MKMEDGRWKMEDNLYTPINALLNRNFDGRFYWRFDSEKCGFRRFSVDDGFCVPCPHIRYTVHTSDSPSLSLTNRQFNGQFKGILACFRYVLTYRVV